MQDNQYTICPEVVCGASCKCQRPCSFVATIRIECSDGFSGNITATDYKPRNWTWDQSSPSGFTSVRVAAGELLDSYQDDRFGSPVTCPSGTKMAGVSAVAYAYERGTLTNLQHFCRGATGEPLLAEWMVACSTRACKRQA